MLDPDIARYVENWVIKTPADPTPRRVSSQDRTLIEWILQEQAGKTRDEAIKALDASFAGWIVQRGRGQRPSALNETDFLALCALLPEPENLLIVRQFRSEGLAALSSILRKMVGRPSWILPDMSRIG